MSPGDSLQLQTGGDQITLRPLHTTGPLAKERGVWVHRTGQRLSASVVNQTTELVRDERRRAALGKAG